MSARILIVGSDTRGAWRMRGLQLGAAIGARCTVAPSARDWQWADRVVLVKRAAMRWQAEAAALTVPVAWDVLDSWAQPEENDATEAAHRAAVSRVAGAVKTWALIGATEAMALDIGGVYLPHHCWSGLVPTPPRPRASVVAYEGSARYLGAWRVAIEQVCARLGLTFVVNPADLREVDALVAFRDGRWDGWACRRWKSGVKYVNAIAAGRPVLTQACAAFDELQPVGMTVTSTDQLEAALAALVTADVRQQAYEAGRRRAVDFTIRTIAQTYRGLLDTLARAA